MDGGSWWTIEKLFGAWNAALICINAYLSTEATQWMQAGGFIVHLSKYVTFKFRLAEEY